MFTKVPPSPYHSVLFPTFHSVIPTTTQGCEGPHSPCPRAAATALTFPFLHGPHLIDCPAPASQALLLPLGPLPRGEEMGNKGQEQPPLMPQGAGRKINIKPLPGDSKCL